MPFFVMQQIKKEKQQALYINAGKVLYTQKLQTF